MAGGVPSLTLIKRNSKSEEKIRKAFVSSHFGGICEAAGKTFGISRGVEYAGARPE